MQLQKDYDLDFFIETSAKTGLNAEELFVAAGKLLFEEHSKYKKNIKKTGEKLKSNREVKKKKGCC